MGRAFAKKLRGFNVEVICYDILEDIEDSNATQVALDELFEKTDILSLHTPQTPLTIDPRCRIGRTRIRKIIL